MLVFFVKSISLISSSEFILQAEILPKKQGIMRQEHNQLINSRHKIREAG